MVSSPIFICVCYGTIKIKKFLERTGEHEEKYRDTSSILESVACNDIKEVRNEIEKSEISKKSENEREGGVEERGRTKGSERT